MNDMQRTVEFYKSLGIDVEPVLTPINVYGEDDYYQITITAKFPPKITGYAGFAVDYKFDLEGNFINMGIWE